MIDELFVFFKNTLTFRGLVVRRNGIFKNALVFIIIFLPAVLVLTYIVEKNPTYIIIAVLVSFISPILGALINAKTVRKKYPKLMKSRLTWSYQGFQQLYLNYLERYLIRIHNKTYFHEIDDAKLDKIQEIISERANQEKIPSIIFITALGALFLPLWSAFLTQFLRLNGKNETDLLIAFGVLISLIVMFAILTPYIIRFRDGLITKYEKWNRLNELISELRLQR